MKETELYPPIKAFLEAQGYVVKGEVRTCDVVARRAAEEPVIVELKISFGLPLVLQGVARQKVSDAVYIAFSADTSSTLWKKNRRHILALCRRLGLGLLVVHPGGTRKRQRVEPVLDPGPYQPRKNTRRRQLLLREFERRRGDPTPGGSTRRPIMTAYRQNALDCARFIADRDDQDSGLARPREIRDATGIETAGAILLRDVYGWFVRHERGVYGLSERGREALKTFAA
ncbi:MAG: DUF2161 family putative PD-(D/E)XK-type phosphodiesterase [Pseudomonadota bacterium]